MRPEPGGSFPAPQLLGWPKGLGQAGIARPPARSPSGWSALPPAVSREVPPLLPSSVEHLGRLGLIPALALVLRFSPPARTKPCAVGETGMLRVPQHRGGAGCPELCQASLPAVPSLPGSSGLKNHLLPGGGRQRSRRSSRISPLRLPPHFSGASVQKLIKVRSRGAFWVAFCGSLKSTWLKACVFSPTEKSTLGTARAVV